VARSKGSSYERARTDGAGTGPDMKHALWIAIITLFAITGFLLIRGLQRLAQQPQEIQQMEGPPPGAPIRTLRLFFGATDHVGLVAEERVVVDPGGIEDLAESVAREVLVGPTHGVTGLDPATKVLSFYLTQDGTGYLDLSRDLITHWPRGDGLEWVSVASLVRSLTENVPAIRTVQILVEGRVVERPPGSIPLDLPLAPEGFGLESSAAIPAAFHSSER
jgi:hypothetical protein